MSAIPTVVPLLLPDGSTSTRITDLMTGPAANSEHLIPTATPSAPMEIIGLESLEPIEAAALLEQAQELPYKPKIDTNNIQVMRVRHHQIARLLAIGHKPAQIARIMDCSATTINNLEKSPAFQALLMEYMNTLDKAAIDTVTRMRVLGALTLDELTSRIADPARARDVKVSDLVEVVKLTADRTGNGPQSSKSVTLNGALSAADIRAFKAAAPPTGPRVFEVSEDGGNSGLCVDTEEPDNDTEVGASLRAPDREVAEERDLIADIVLSVVGI
jgi:hypothetical protein